LERSTVVKRWRKGIAGLFIAMSLLLAAGCGPTSGGQDLQDTQISSEGGGRELRINATDFAFAPKEIHLKEGESVVLALINKGALEHDLQFDPSNLHLHTKVGGAARSVFTAPQKGSYEMFCSIAGHKEQGMVLKLIVE